MRSIFHNVTNFPPFEQLAGKEYKSEILELGETSTISLQLKACYDPGCPLVSYKRTVTHFKGKEIMLKEEVEGDVKPVLTLMSMHKPSVQENIITLGASATLELQTPFKSIIVEEIPITDARLRSVWPEKLYRILVAYETALLLQIK